MHKEEEIQRQEDELA
jgi:pre-mRNA-splicing factor CDC5/CEF1